MFLFCLVFAMFCVRLFICALGQVWYLIVSIPDLCNLITCGHLLGRG